MRCRQSIVHMAFSPPAGHCEIGTGAILPNDPFNRAS